MVETLEQFFTASFKGPGRQAFSARAHGLQLESFRIASEAAHTSGIAALTRLRIIAPNDVVSAAETLHKVDDEVRGSIFVSDQLPSGEQWEDLRRRQREAREVLLGAARKTLDLGKGHPIGSLNHFRPI